MQDKADFRLNPGAHFQQFVALFALLLIVWIVMFWRGIVTAVDIWLISDIFNHCLFVLPGAFYLIYLKRKELSVTEIKPVGWPLLLCIGCALLYLIGIAGDVQLFMHIATFTFLPLAIWACVGHTIAKKIFFPLFFMVFCIPFGEELIPSLQKITADLAVIMLNWTSIPIYRSGLYIEIPQGRFLVAEACSGISFFIASVVIGALYSYLNIYSAKRRIWFVTLSIFVPIIANAVRVFGIIVIAYLTDMEHAAGADHLIYGWFFFAFVIILLLAVGELVREKQAPTPQALSPVRVADPNSPRRFGLLATYLVLFFAVFFSWQQFIYTQQEQLQNPPKLNTNSLQTLVSDASSSAWKPIFNGAYDSYAASINVDNENLDVFIAWYPKGFGELISSLHRYYDEKQWTLDESSQFALDQATILPLKIIVSSQGYRALTHWYVIDGKVFADKKLAKLYEIYQLMKGQHVGGWVVILSQDIEMVNKTQDIEKFKHSVQQARTLFSSSLISP